MTGGPARKHEQGSSSTLAGLAARWNAYWFRPAALADLGVLRIAVVGCELAWMLAGTLRAELAQTFALPAEAFDPVLATIVLGAGSRPAPELLLGLHDLALVAGISALAGFATRASLACFALAVVYLQGFAYSFGSFYHHQAALAIALAVLALAPSGDALSLDAWLAARRGVARPRLSAFARWPLLLVQWVLALTFLSAALSKLGRGGLEWLNGSTIQFWAFMKGAKLDTPLGVWLSEQHEVARALSWFTVVLESTFWLAIVWRPLVWLYVPAAAAFFTGIHLTLGAAFYQHVALLCAFAPWRASLDAAAGGLAPGRALGGLGRRRARPDPQSL